MTKRDLALPAFPTQERLKAVSARLHISPNTLRIWWEEEFGEQAFRDRAKKMQALGVCNSNKSRKGNSRKQTYEELPCEDCGANVTVSRIQKSRLNRILCLSCKDAEKGVDRYCPVCGLGCVGVKGLARHMRGPKNDLEAHKTYLGGQDPWGGKKEGWDFVRCRICDHKGTRIDKHLSSQHGLSLGAYRNSNGGTRPRD